MTTAEPAWKKFLKLKSDVPVAAANLADNSGLTGVKRKREALPPQKPNPSILKKPKDNPGEIAEKKARANKQKKKAKTKTKRSKKDEADSKAAQTAALEYLSLYCAARSEWKFSKPKQNYLLKNTYSDEMIPDDRFTNLLTYLHGLQGGARERCLETAEGLIDRYEKQQTGDNTPRAEESSEAKTDAENEEEVEDVTEDQFERAKSVKAKLTDDNEESAAVQAQESDSSTSDSDSSAE
ncbi:Putative uncharacterized protein [Taphrina deformans PYCC 5710]|uniref:WKF domain-containing protein n=1 Tax=Taphrina deformans (strain PYCC 5710 / ATCC 11124 / CBS 356.35 / IMI 108563 / JCM 9778 / NBRC 8474) TaxID=1097556 RepID=R4X7U6_TAPDE|nr:Putative uncharacterized protein [Taphrina deformans PYCC 5710]|eukprot:CCG81281.1 Putative uncharacterized protein [Taphrina deformans PYCC 5710]